MIVMQAIVLPMIVLPVIVLQAPSGGAMMPQ